MRQKVKETWRAVVWPICAVDALLPAAHSQQIVSCHEVAFVLHRIVRCSRILFRRTMQSFIARPRGFCCDSHSRTGLRRSTASLDRRSDGHEPISLNIIFLQAYLNIIEPLPPLHLSPTPLKPDQSKSDQRRQHRG